MICRCRCLLIALTVSGALNSTQAEPSLPLVIAHRGASGYLPEHTLAAKALAFGMQADYVEQDVVITRDGQPIVLHDIHLDTVTDVARKFPDRDRDDGRYYAIDFSLAEIKQLRVHERVAPKTHKPVFGQRFPVNESLFQIPSLAEELQLVQGMNRTMRRRVGVYPEIKLPAWHRRQGQDISGIVLNVLKRFGYEEDSDPVYVQCFDANELKRIRVEIGSHLKLVQLLRDDCETETYSKASLRAIAEYADGIGPPLTCVVTTADDQSPQITSVVDLAHQYGLFVHPYTFRADAMPDYAENFHDLHKIFFKRAGVDGIFTDFPDRSVAARAELMPDR